MVVLGRLGSYHGSSYRSSCITHLLHLAAAVAPPGGTSCSLAVAARLLTALPSDTLLTPCHLAAARAWLLGPSDHGLGPIQHHQQQQLGGVGEGVNGVTHHNQHQQQQQEQQGQSCQLAEGKESARVWVAAALEQMWEEYFASPSSSSSSSSGSPSFQDYNRWSSAANSCCCLLLVVGRDMPQLASAAASDLAARLNHVVQRGYLPWGMEDRVLLMLKALLRTAAAAGEGDAAGEGGKVWTQGAKHQHQQEHQQQQQQEGRTAASAAVVPSLQQLLLEKVLVVSHGELASIFRHKAVALLEGGAVAATTGSSTSSSFNATFAVAAQALTAAAAVATGMQILARHWDRLQQQQQQRGEKGMVFIPGSAATYSALSRLLEVACWFGDALVAKGLPLVLPLAAAAGATAIGSEAAGAAAGGGEGVQGRVSVVEPGVEGSTAAAAVQHARAAAMEVSWETE